MSRMSGLRKAQKAAQRPEVRRRAARSLRAAYRLKRQMNTATVEEARTLLAKQQAQRPDSSTLREVAKLGGQVRLDDSYTEPPTNNQVNPGYAKGYRDGMEALHKRLEEQELRFLREFRTAILCITGRLV